MKHLTNTPFPWTDRMRKQLPALWKDYTASQIAVRFGFGTGGKNAVIGMCRRLGLAKKGNPVKKDGAPKEVRKPRIDVDMIRRLHAQGYTDRVIARVVKCNPKTVAKYTASEPKPIVRPPMVVVASPKQITLDVPEPVRIVPPPPLSSGRGCQWIDGDVRVRGWRFCDAPTAHGSWCAVHARRVFARPSEREAA